MGDAQTGYAICCCFTIFVIFVMIGANIASDETDQLYLLLNEEDSTTATYRDCEVSNKVPQPSNTELILVARSEMVFFWVFLGAWVSIACINNAKCITLLGGCALCLSWVWMWPITGMVWHIYMFLREQGRFNSDNPDCEYSYYDSADRLLWGLVPQTTIVALTLCTFCILMYQAITDELPSTTSSSTSYYHTNTTNTTSTNYYSSQPQTTQVVTYSEPKREGQYFGLGGDVNKRAVLQQLSRISPSGSTKLRDAVGAAVLQMRELQKICEAIQQESGGGDDRFNFQFVNVVLTDGMDTSSRLSLNELNGLFIILRDLLGQRSITYLIGVGSDEREFSELRSLAQANESTVKFVHVRNNTAIGEVFDRIQLELGIVRETALLVSEDMVIGAQRQRLEVNMRVNRFVVLFTIDKSGSMEGQKWESTYGGLESFLSHLTEYDLFGVQVFSDDLHWLTM